jgi:hypothetical protein
MTTNITEKLERLAETREDFDKLQAMQEKLVNEAIPAEVKARLDEIEAEFGPLLQAAANGIALLENEIKTAVLEGKASVKGARLQAVYTKGKETWDGKSLAGFALAHPEILALRSYGAPSVSIRVVSGGRNG